MHARQHRKSHSSLPPGNHLVHLPKIQFPRSHTTMESHARAHTQKITFLFSSLGTSLSTFQKYNFPETMLLTRMYRCAPLQITENKSMHGLTIKIVPASQSANQPASPIVVVSPSKSSSCDTFSIQVVAVFRNVFFQRWPVSQPAPLLLVLLRNHHTGTRFPYKF